jgi:hypothetical protein
MQDFVAAALNTFGWLHALTGARIVESAPQAGEPFGNSLVTIEVGPVRVRVVRDKSQVFVEVCAVLDREAWIDLNELLELLSTPTLVDQGLFPLEGEQVRRLGLMSAALQEHYRDITRMLSTGAYGATRQAIADLRQARLAALRNLQWRAEE